MKRLIRDGNSALLFHMAESIGNVTESIGATQSVNVMNATVLNAVSGGEKRGSVSKANRVSQIADDNDLFEVDSNADRNEVVRQRREEEREREEEEKPRREWEEKKRKRNEWCMMILHWTIQYAIIALILALLFSCMLFLIPIPESPQQQAIKQLMDCVGTTVSDNMTKLVVPSNRCNDEGIDLLDFSVFPRLKSIEIGDGCFANVNEVKLIGLSKLKRIVIGENSFTKSKNGSGNDPNRHFCLSDCERLRELKIGRFSFSDYSLVEIEDVDRLEVIEVGDLNEDSANFYSASLELNGETGLIN